MFLHELFAIAEGAGHLAALLSAVAVAWLAWTVLEIALTPRDDSYQDMFERGRREALRSASATYRWFEPLIDEMSRLNDILQEGSIRSLRNAFRIVPELPPWTPAEYLAASQLEGVTAGAVVFPVAARFFGLLPAAVIALALVPLWQYLSVGQITQAASERAYAVKMRFPFALDILSMIMAAGLEFNAGLRSVVNALGPHPLGLELGELLRKVDLGTSPRDAFQQLSELFTEDDDIREFASAVVQGLDLGTPLKAIFRIQADQIRLKRSQWLEKAAAKAEVQITGPGMVIAIACMLVLLAPFLLVMFNMS